MFTTSKVDYANKKFLIIDDFPEFRSSVKKMVEYFGGKSIDLAGDGEDAIEKMSKTNYDVVLSDYNLGGEGKDGQQVLEEAKFAGYLQATSIYIMLTAESTLEMVMGALEYEPDGYLTKPFNKEMLSTRLEKIAEKKEGLTDILKAMNKKKWADALSLCDSEIQNKTKNMMDALKIKGKILLEQEEWEKARAIYEQVLSVRPLPWALLGKGKILYFMGDFYEASNVFQELVQQNQMYVEGYDWLAKCKEKLNDLEDAQKILESAVKLSPKAILRQQALGEIAKRNEDYLVAEKAFRQAVKLGKFSCYKSPDNALDLAKTLAVKASGEAGITTKRAGNEALQVLKEVSRAYPEEPKVGLRSSLLEAETHINLKQPAEAKSAINKAEKTFQKMGSKAGIELSMDLAKGFFSVGAKDKAIELASSIIKDNFEDQSLRNKLDDFAKSIGISDAAQTIVAAEERKLADLNRQGVAFYESGKLQEAVDLFEKAAEDMPGNQSANLNAAQSLLTFMEKNGKEPSLLNRARKYLDRVVNLDKTDKRYARFRELFKMLERIAAGS